MIAYICSTCGTQFAETDGPPTGCPICQDERQYVGPRGQTWTDLDSLRRTHWNTTRAEEANLIGIGMEPKFAIGQRALLIRAPSGNMLWDCIPLLDHSLVELLQAVGGISAIAISHPHYYSTMVEWARAFGCPIWVHRADAAWVQCPDTGIRFWEGEQHELAEGITLVRCGGHFDGGTVLWWKRGAEGRGALLTGDIIQVVPDRRWVSFMYSYPNLIPLPGSTVQRIAAKVESLEFDRVYGAFWDMTIVKGAKAAVRHSAERYVAALERGRP